jgi:hypothetical protein
MDKIVVLLLLAAVSAFADWRKKRAKEEERRRQLGGGASPTVTGAPAPSPAAPPIVAPRPAAGHSGNWEDELRRLFGEEEPEKPAQRPTAPPPVVISPTARRVPPPIPPTRRPPATMPAGPIRAPAPRISPRPAPIPVPTVTSLETRPLASMTESTQAYSQAQKLDESMGAHIDKVPNQLFRPTEVVRTRASAEAYEAVSWFRNARGARKAILATVILGRPRALQPQEPEF